MPDARKRDVNLAAMGALVRRDLTAVRRSRATMVPLLLVPALIAAFLPAVVATAPRLSASLPGSEANMRAMMESLAPGMRRALAGLAPDQAITVLIGVYLLAPVFLILPFMVASALAADSVAGERERKTLEALLYTPLTDSEIFFAKTFAAWLPALFVTGLSFVVYGLVLNVAAWPVMGRVFFPNAMWVVLALWVAPAVAALGLGAMVLVSVRVRGAQEAMQLGGLLVLPLVLLVVAQVRGGMMLGTRVVAVMGALIWALSAVVLWQGARTLRRPKLIAKV